MSCQLHAASGSNAHSKWNPKYAKSTLIGAAFPRRSSSMMNWKPLMSTMLSVSFGSSRARFSLGPPHPPEFKNIRIGLRSLPVKYSLSLSVANFVTSSIVTSPQKYLFYDFKTCGKIGIDIGIVNWLGSDGCAFLRYHHLKQNNFMVENRWSIAAIVVFEFRFYQIIIIFTLPFGRSTQTGRSFRENELSPMDKASEMMIVKSKIYGLIFWALSWKIAGTPKEWEW